MGEKWRARISGLEMVDLNFAKAFSLGLVSHRLPNWENKNMWEAKASPPS